MIEMKYRTRGNSDPHGKSRVFFTCHQDDHDKYFEWTTDLLYKYQNCTVFYLEPVKVSELYHALDKDADEPERVRPSEESDLMNELESRVSEMQLIVVPVTTKLLTQKNLAIDVIYAIAVRRHIPVLPLMMETGLDGLFTDRFGDLQYLQPNNIDSTAIPFEERLEKYLNDVLVGDDLAERVRNAFDAYIFLSYRKKDRAFAQQLMRMIHRSKSCRDIAIWYDEFLVPGENFNSAIRTALKKSKLFTLVVTPNLLEEGNYVMQYEYPEAKAQGKDILPVEMKKTDLDLLRRFYAEFPEYIGLDDQDTWAEILATYLKKIAVDSNDEDPIHNFLIGLAYLDGIDVEVDSDKAVELITGAAETGLEEAIRKLVSMYHDGKGVARDYEVSAGWQEKLVEILEEKYRSSQSEDDRFCYISALLELGDAWFDMRRLQNASKAYLKMHAIASEGDQETWENQRYLLVSYHRLGNIETALGHLKEAGECYRKAFKISEKSAEESGTVDARQNLAVGYGRLGDTEKALGHPKEAREYYTKALKIREELAEETKTVKSRQSLTVIFGRLGDIEMVLGHLKEAAEYYRKALKISEELVEETESVEVRRDLSVSTDHLGDIEEALGHLKEAGEYYRKALKIREELTEETGTVESRRDLFVSYNKLGYTEKELGHLKEAGEYYRKALKISEELAEETGTVESRRDLAASYGSLGDTEKALGHPEEAVEYYRKALKISEELAEETDTVEARRNLAISYNSLGNIEMASGHLKEAGEYYRKGLKISEELAEETGTEESRRDLSISYNRLGDTEKALDHLKEAGEYYRKALVISEELAEETGTVGSRRNLLVSYDRLGNIEMALGHLKEAGEYYRKALAISEELAEKTETVERLRDLCISYIKLGNTEKALGHLKEAGEYYRKELKIREELAEETRTATSYRDLMISLYELSTVEAALLGKQYAADKMKKAVKIAEILADTLQTEQADRDLSFLRNYLNKLL